MLDIDKCLIPKEKKTKLLTVRVTPEIRETMRKKKLSPTMVFNEALRELGLR